MTSYRLRIQLDDVPGALAEVTAALARGGCDVLRVDVHGVDGRVVVDELSVIAPPATAADGLAALVAEAGALPVLIAPLALESDVDPVAAALRLATELAGEERPEARTSAAERGLARLLDADGAWILPAPTPGDPLLTLDTVASPTVATVNTVGGNARDAVATVALLPHGDHVGVALRWGRWSFTASELARAEALVALALRSGTPATPPSTPTATLEPTHAGSLVAVRRVGPRDAAHVLDLDLRLSDRTRRLRFNASRGLPTGRELRTATTPDDATVVVGAWTERGLVGVARAVPLRDDPSTAELAVVVADADQRRGIGSVLVQRLAAEARVVGVRRLVAATAPHNDAIRRLLARLSPASITRIAHGEVEVLVDLDAVAAHASRSAFRRA